MGSFNGISEWKKQQYKRGDTENVIRKKIMFFVELGTRAYKKTDYPTIDVDLSKNDFKEYKAIIRFCRWGSVSFENNFNINKKHYYDFMRGVCGNVNKKFTEYKNSKSYGR